MIRQVLIMAKKIGIIGGSGMDDPKLLSNPKITEMETPYGKPSDKLLSGI